MRDADFDDWAGGRALRLEVASVGTPERPVESLTPGANVAFAITGAEPGEALHFFVGALCGLDCPVDRDGACFQAADSVEIGVATADAAGTAALEVVPDPTWEARWLVFQVTAPGRRAVSQAWVDRIGTWHAPLTPPGELVTISPLTLHSQMGEQWTLPVQPGRPLVARYDAVDYDDDVTVRVVSGGEVTFFPEVYPLGVALDRPGRLYWQHGEEDSPGRYTLDLTTAPLDAPVAWFPDGDGDGYGDPLGVTVVSTVPVPDATPNALDCDDLDPAVHPHGVEICDDGLDQDCDGTDRRCDVDPGVVRVGGPLAFIGTALAIGDLDGDGSADLVATGSATAISPVTRGDVLSPAVVLASAVAAAVGDLTDDGVPDLFLSDESGEGTVYAGPVTPASAVGVVPSTLVVSWMLRPAIGDVSGDGVADLLLSDANGSTGVLNVYLGPFAAANASPDGTIPTTQGGLSRHDVALGDGDGDGLSDVWTHEVCLILAPVDLLAAASVGCVDDGVDDNLAVYGLTTADVDADGYADAVVGGPSGVHVFLGPLAGAQAIDDATWSFAEVPDQTSGWASGVAPDRAGEAELLVATSQSAWSVPALAGTWTQDDGTTLRTDAATAIVGGDFDADGAGDVAIGVSGASYDDVLEGGVAYLLWGPG